MSQKCVFCDSKSVVRNGLRKRKVRTKQSFLCNVCDRQFVEPDGFERMRFKPEIISRAVHQHEDGFSLSKVKNHLWQHEDAKVSRWTISKWKKKYSLFFGSNSNSIFNIYQNYTRKDNMGSCPSNRLRDLR